MKRKTLAVVAGEISGDNHGASLCRSLLEKIPNLNFIGVGGERLAALGLKSIIPFDSMKVMGFTDVIKKLPFFLSSFWKVRDEIIKEDPVAVLLVDYPGFNLRLANSLRKKGYRGKIVQYVSPSVWAWKAGRIHQIAKNYDLLLTILPFEKECYEKTPLSVVYVGNPSLESVRQYQIQNKPIAFQDKVLGLFPGSRKSEVERNLPLMLEVCANLSNSRNFDDIVKVSCASQDLKVVMEKVIKKAPFKDVVIEVNQNVYDLMNQSKAALAVSGTVVLELALFKVPTVVVYQLSWLNDFLVKYIIKPTIPYFTLPNLIAKRRVFPEYHGKTLPLKEITQSLLNFIEPTQVRQNSINLLDDLSLKLGDKKPSLEGANILCEWFNEEN